MTDIGVIFDFNGTMFFDGEFHNRAWKTCVEDLSMTEVSDRDMRAWIVGRTPKEILEHFMGYELNDSMVFQFSEEKERIYRNMIAKEKERTGRILTLAPGLKEFLDYLTKAEVPIAIASTADLQNMVLYYDLFRLERWFEWDKIIFYDGKLKSKPSPDLYNAAISKIKVPSQFCVAFEDSYSGVTAAYLSGIRNIIAVTGDSWNMQLIKEPGVIAAVKDYTELNKENFR